MNNLRRLDLNLLVTLDTLLSEQNVTRTAQRLNFSQPSVSVHLAKLRDIFDDPLLLPGPRGMRPTARAEELRQPLQDALRALEHAISPSSPFDPASATNTWRISAFDYGESTILLPALAGLRSAAPGTRLAIFEVTPSLLAKKAEQGEIDLAFHIHECVVPGLRHRILFSEKYVLVGRVGHPKLKAPLSVEQFCQLEQVIVSPDGGGFHGVTDRELSKIGLSRCVVLSVPHFLFVKSVLATTDLVAMLPSRLVRGEPELQAIEPPIEIPSYEMAMFWHERCHRDPAHQWLREFIAGSV